MDLRDGATMAGEASGAAAKACAILFEQAPTPCRDGGTGRRSGLKIRRSQGRGGSTPPPGTIKSIVYRVFLPSPQITRIPSSQLCSQLDLQSAQRFCAMPRVRKEKRHRGVFEREKGSNIWWVRFVDVDGKRKATCIGSFSNAVDFYEAEKVRVRKRIIAPVASRRGVRYKQLVEAALVYNEQSHRDQRNFAQRLEAILDQFGHRMADTIITAEIAEWFAQMEDERGWTPATINRYRAAMSKAFKLGIADGKVSRNPARLVPQHKESNGRVRFLLEEEEKRLRAALAGRPNCIPQLEVALHTGMR